MSSRVRPRASRRAIGIWMIALLVAVVATIQIRSQAEVVRSLVGTDTTSLAFLIASAMPKKQSITVTLSVSERPALLEASGRRRTSRPLQVDRVLSFKLQHFKS